MKAIFTALFMLTADAQGMVGIVTAPLAPVLKSDNLTKLQAEYSAAWAAMLKFTDPFAKETKDAKLALWKIEGEIKTEEQLLQKLANDAKIAEQRNLRLQLNTNQLSAHAALLTLQADKKATPEALTAAQEAFNTAKEAVDNELLAKYANSTTTKKVSTDGKEKTAKSDTDTAAIIEMHIAGKSNKDIEEAGYARSTVWHAIDKYKKANA